MSGLFKILLVALLLLSAGVFAQCPPNIGFEDGTFKNWECSAGSIDAGGLVSMTSIGQMYGRHTIFSAATQSGVLDTYGHFPAVCPNGSKYSVKLGNELKGAQAERVTYTFTVPPGAEYSLILNYAVVLQNPTHSDYQQPKFTAQIYDITDDKYINCPSFNFVASADLPGFKLSDVDADTANSRSPSTIYYKDWSSTTINLVGYSGKSVRLEFTTNDCTLGGHFGYAYLDLNEECEQAITGNTYCSGQDSISLHAPTGFYDYFWYKGDFTQQVGRGEILKLNPAPPDQTKYIVAIVPYPGLGCPDTLYTTINKLNTPYKLKVVDTVYGCEGFGADLTDPAVTYGSSLGLKYSYFKDISGDIYLPSPQAAPPGTYYIRGVNPDGCTSIKPVHVVIRARPVIRVTDPEPVRYPGVVDLSTTFTPQGNVNYLYYTDPKCTDLVIRYRSVGLPGTYYIKATDNTSGCETITYVKVTITPPPSPIISAPNVFTPNNDGINDQFMVTLKGFIDFGSVKIFNRYGQLLYTAKTVNDFWDGTYNGHMLESGTYYWIFEGTDQYFHTKVTKASSISILR